jgi:hypothetical protein
MTRPEGKVDERLTTAGLLAPLFFGTRNSVKREEEENATQK